MLVAIAVASLHVAAIRYARCDNNNYVSYKTYDNYVSYKKTYDNYVSAKRRLRQQAIMLRLTRWKMLPLACAAEPDGQ